MVPTKYRLKLTYGGYFNTNDLAVQVLPWLQIETRSESLGLDYPTPPVIDSQILSHWEIQKAVVDQQVRNKGQYA